MSVDKVELCGFLFIWLWMFYVLFLCVSFQDLSSGFVIVYVLNQIDFFWFNEVWFQGILEDLGFNWKLKVSNLKMVLWSLVEYFQDVLVYFVLEEYFLDVSFIGEFLDLVEFGKLFQLVLGCVISCEKKQEYIQRIMMLEELVQYVVMEVIQEFMIKDIFDFLLLEIYGNFDSQFCRYYFLSEEVEEGDELQQCCLDLEWQLMFLLEEKQSLV